MWNHRIVDVSDGVEEPIYEIREVFYNSKGLPYGHSDAAIVGENLEEMQDIELKTEKEKIVLIIYFYRNKLSFSFDI